MESNNKLLMSVDDVVSATGICRTKVFAVMKSGKLKAVKIGRRTFVRPGDLRDFIEGAIEPRATEAA